MRLTIVNQFYPPDAAPTGRLAADLAEHRAALGDTVTVLASRANYVAMWDQAPRRRFANLKVCRLWTPPCAWHGTLGRCLGFLAFLLLAAWRFLWMPRQDVVVAMTTPPFLVCAALVHKLRHPACRVILWNMDCYPEVAERDGLIKPGRWISRALRALNRAAFRQLDRVVCLDPAMAELLQANYGRPGHSLPTAVVPNWEPLADCPRCAAAAPHRDRQTSELLGEKFVVIYTGNRGRGHEFDTVLAAAERLRNEPVCFLFVGGGTRTPALRQAIAAAHLKNVMLVPYVPQAHLHRLLRAADCALVTLRNEMLGIMSPSKLHASLGFGLPIVYVGPPGSNVDQAIMRFGCGVSLRPGDVQGLVAALQHLRANPQDMARLRYRARLAFEQEYCDQKTLPLLDALLDHPAAVCEMPAQEKMPATLRRAA